MIRDTFMGNSTETHHLPVLHHPRCCQLTMNIRSTVYLHHLHLLQRTPCVRLRHTVEMRCVATTAFRPVRWPYCDAGCCRTRRLMPQGECCVRTWRRGTVQVKRGGCLPFAMILITSPCCIRQFHVAASATSTCMHSFERASVQS